jgi:hypothetical protein
MQSNWGQNLCSRYPSSYCKLEETAWSMVLFICPRLALASAVRRNERFVPLIEGV